jgi:polyisoprenyl-teichoic acid--peptidoglycan teichoic acid transferase
MRVPKLDLRTPDQKDEPKKKLGRFAVFFIVSALTVGAIALSTNVIFSDHPVVDLGANTFLGQVRALIRSGDRKLVGEKDDRVNVLILGIGGEGHDGPQLTDTVILASYKPSTGKVALVSIPRDLLIQSKDYGAVKINAVNAYAEAKQKGSGPAAEAHELAIALGQPIDYWAKIDFSGFQKIIDAIGGVDVTVDRSFTDASFPMSDSSDAVRTISFSAGAQHMNGKTALDFARSRHGSNGEGSDFARSKRQEKIILAVREKLLRAGTLLNPFTLNSLFDTVKGSLSTNLQTWETIRLASQASGIKTSDVSLHVMSDDNVLVNGMTDEGAFVLRPKNNDWSAVAAFAGDVFAASSAAASAAAPAAKPPAVRIEVQNGTAVTGLAQRTANSLMAAGFAVSKVGNAQERGYDKSVIYDLTKTKNAEALVKIRSVVDANVAPILPAAVSAPTDADYLIILGKNATL